VTEVTPHPLKTQGFHHFLILLFYDHAAKGLFLIFRKIYKKNKKSTNNLKPFWQRSWERKLYQDNAAARYSDALSMK